MTTRLSARAVLLLLLVAGLAIRIAVIGNHGFQNDIESFASWAITLAQHPFSQFYGSAGFADYPPGYFYILALVGHAWLPLHGLDPHFEILYRLVKVPAILADLGVGVLLFALVRRFTTQTWALIVAGLYLLNPATVTISAAWGQVDAIAGGLALLAFHLLVRSGDLSDDRTARWIVGAWAVLAYSLLIKPQAAVLVPLFVAYAWADPQRRGVRLRATLGGMVVALVLAWLVALPFHPSLDPIAVLAWLYERYAYATSVYPFNSVNAFNLWTAPHKFWEPDNTLVGFGAFALPQYVWGIALVVLSVAMLVWRYLQERTDAALLEASALALLAFFMLATRMHERYVFDGVLFTLAAVGIARRYLVAAVIFSLVLFFNLTYSLDYLAFMQHPVAGVDPKDLWPLRTHLLSALNVATFFVLGYQFLGREPRAQDEAPAEEAAPANGLLRTLTEARRWFDPREGLEGMRWPLDYAVAAALGVASFILSYVRYWFPPSKYFDEIYFARAAEEYLTHRRIYENTHPPLTKLLITLSTMLFGGMPKGDTSWGWRFGDVVFGAIAVVVLYVFAKRVTRSTVFSAIAAVLLILDGMHFVQSRIATPEGFVVVFSVSAVYLFYRYWISAQTAVRERAMRSWRTAWWSAAILSLSGAAILYGVLRILDMAGVIHQSVAAVIIECAYAALIFQIVLRTVILPRLFGGTAVEISYPDASYAVRDGAATVVYTPDGGVLEGGRRSVRLGTRTQKKGDALVYTDGELSITYRRDAVAEYRTPVAQATFEPDVLTCEGRRERGTIAPLWLIAFSSMLGLLVASKWYGVMGFGVSFTVLIGLWLQNAYRGDRIALWGNPRGVRLDVALCTIVAVAATVYWAAWIPDMVRKAPGDIQNFSDVVYRQYSMFEYHDKLRATHPYESKWWEWPIDRNPIAYYYQDLRPSAKRNDPNACCVEEIESLPNPGILWFGLLAVPVVGWLGWRERNKAYVLLVLAYLLQWLPWMFSPRLDFAYHFYVNIPLICLCIAIFWQRLWQWATARGGAQRTYAAVAIGGYLLLVGGLFVFFYPILAGVPITWNAWHERMWFPSWIVGPG